MASRGRHRRDHVKLKLTFHAESAPAELSCQTPTAALDIRINDMTTGSTQAVGSSASSMPSTADNTATPTSIWTNRSSNWSRSICHCVRLAAWTSTFRPATSLLLVTSASDRPASGFAAKRVTVSVAVHAWALSASATVGNEMGAGVAEPPLNESFVLGRRRGSAAARPAHSSNARIVLSAVRGARKRANFSRQHCALIPQHKRHRRALARLQCNAKQGRQVIPSVSIR